MCLKNGNCANKPTLDIIKYYINNMYKDTLLTDNTIIFEQNVHYNYKNCMYRVLLHFLLSLKG